MLKFKFIFCLLILVQNFCFSQIFKAAVNPEKILSELKKSSLATQSIQANFTEEKYLAALKDSQKSTGIFYYKKNDKIKWEQNTPFNYVILINGDRIQVKEAGKEKNVGSANRMASQIKELMIGLVNGDFQENKAFKQEVFESENQYQIILTPVNRRLKNVYSKINLLFIKNTLRLKELIFYEKGGDKNVMKFQNEKINQPIAEDVFLSL